MKQTLLTKRGGHERHAGIKQGEQGVSRGLEKAVKAQLASAAGTSSFANRDPVYHISESFTKSFEAEGKRLAAGMAQKDSFDGSGNFASERADAEKSMDSLYRPREGMSEFWSRFSDIAFNRGTLSSAILRRNEPEGEGDTDGAGHARIMLFSCLKRTIGQSQPKNERQSRLFEASSVHRAIPGHPAGVIFNRSTVDSAVGITCDALRNARRTVDAMSELASGESVLAKGSGAETLEKLYPYLSIEKETAAIDKYRSQLSEDGSDNEQRSVLSAAIAKNEALIAKKRQMRQNLINELYRISENAAKAVEAFSDDSFRAAAYERLKSEAEQPDDSSDGGEPDGDDNMKGKE